MPKPRVTATDRLSNVMSVVDLGRRTGLLSVERTVGLMLEEGEMYFVSGAPIYATLGRLRGHDALVELAQWSECRFCFDPHAPQPIPNIAGLLPTVDRSSPSGIGFQYAPPAGFTGVPPAEMSPAGMSPAASGVYPGLGPAASGGRPFPMQPGPSSAPPPGSWPAPASGYPGGYSNGDRGGSMPGGAGATPGMHPGATSGATSGASGVNWGASSVGFGSGPLTPHPPSGFGAAGRSAPASGGSSPESSAGSRPRPTDLNAQARLQRRPRRAPDVRDLINVVTTYNLTRAHRTVLLLADGEHSVLDLSRLSGKPVDEVTNLLHELEGRGLVYYHQ